MTRTTMTNYQKIRLLLPWQWYLLTSVEKANAYQNKVFAAGFFPDANQSDLDEVATRRVRHWDGGLFAFIRFLATDSLIGLWRRIIDRTVRPVLVRLVFQFGWHLVPRFIMLRQRANVGWKFIKA